MINISKNKRKHFKSFGNIIKVEKLPNEILFHFTNGTGKIRVYSPKLIRFILTPQTEFDLDHSYAVIKPFKEWDTVSYKYSENSNSIRITTDALIVEINKTPYKVVIKENKENGIILCEDDDSGMGACFDFKNSNIRSYKKIHQRDHFFGFGEKTGPLDKRGRSMKMSSRDFPYRKNSDPMYQSHPLFINMNHGIAYAIFFDNISKTIFDMGKTDKKLYYFDAAKGDLNYYFIFGPSIDNILEIYTELIGRMEMPPKWAIAYHQCRDSYKNEKQIKEIISKFRKNQIPCDGIWFDIYYMDGFRCFTFDYKRFPYPKQLMKELKQQGFKPVVIIDPGIKIDENYKIYQELFENKYYTPKKNGKPSLGWVWPGNTVFPDFTKEEVRKWWTEKHKFYFDLGIDGIWNDMNEPALSVNPLISWIKRLHSKDMYLDNQKRHSKLEDAKNVYALCEAQATWKAFNTFKPNERSFILTRSGYSGIQRYAASWTGDNWSCWTSITLAIRMLLNLNLSGQAFVGSDIGGFFGLMRLIKNDKAQFIRWIQSGVFYPFCRVHSFHRTKQQDPFSFGKKAQQISKKYIELRYELLPYWYNLFYEAHKFGKPIIRPLFYEDPEDERCYDKKFENEFFVGNDILIIPINKRRIKNIRIYLPEGKWINYWTLQEFKGRMEHNIPITLDDIPIFIRKGAIIPTQPVLEYVGQQPIDILILKIFKGENNTSTSIFVYEDDGISKEYMEQNKSCNLNIKGEFKEKKSNLLLSELKGNYKPSWKYIKFIIYDNGEKIMEDTLNFTAKNIEITF